MALLLGMGKSKHNEANKNLIINIIYKGKIKEQIPPKQTWNWS